MRALLDIAERENNTYIGKKGPILFRRERESNTDTGREGPITYGREMESNSYTGTHLWH